MTKTADYLYAAASAAKRHSRPLNVVGPYSEWPRKDRTVKFNALNIRGATFAAGSVAQCVSEVSP